MVKMKKELMFTDNSVHVREWEENNNRESLITCIVIVYKRVKFSLWKMLLLYNDNNKADKCSCSTKSNNYYDVFFFIAKFSFFFYFFPTLVPLLHRSVINQFSLKRRPILYFSSLFFSWFFQNNLPRFIHIS